MSTVRAEETPGNTEERGESPVDAQMTFLPLQALPLPPDPQKGRPPSLHAPRYVYPNTTFRWEPLWLDPWLVEGTSNAPFLTPAHQTWCSCGCWKG